ncbi:PTS system D-fructose-specific IIC component (F1P-forming), Frc family, PTS system D-fructose-specific IIB component (F1P-forming), Frc family TC 4.A.2.1.1) [Desulfosporosinus acidiphilus SJ4]|uniref:PTS system D-fructose-specific IIC component (F1P-forming), Frc family, PTS system D-fructose-specific IIB component (F1P-forming), Frc family TC 4.A.2.1.1 n=1 Tax=Desulfosporosinus acidiphilus (strain DSM 22704 / JCM 16185 / SJ4) TaxID=646529 RepID=I4DB37_DESAJ|nr:fructose-specific PTS transporter subunit EIIC [Desulfosporosinus acidiphilus]AFM43011.1 PTS system D-fructose-specific IIC component (F1P-forming), Frc family, PTS system D-fructose-specific IIB component (F1P-forming), Frc family TC 4.A.2.1.1) [Desulfosporosinus acidiphilus SJ4]
MKFVAVTSCPTGIAHTYMAAEALQLAAKEMGHEIKVETQGSVGAEDVLTKEDLAQAKAVIIAADTSVDKSRFAGMAVVEVSVKEAINDAKGLLTKAANAKASSSERVVTDNAIKSEGKESKKGVYKHLMTGVSFMIPFVVAGGLLIALGFAIGGIYVFKVPGSLGETLFSTGKAAFALMIPVLGAYISYSIADRPGIVPGMVGGFIASNNGSGFLGAMVAGFAAGYIVLAIKKYIKLPKSLQGLMPILIIPFLSTAIMGLLMVYVIGKPMTFFNTTLAAWLSSLSGANAVVLGIILGCMMAFDMGGPVNKAAYAFATATVASGKPSAIMAAVMAAGMVPPLGIALSTVIAKKKYTLEEREAGKANWALGLSFITEGAIPFAAADPLRVIPSIMAGSAVTGAISMAFGSTIIVPHGGIWVLAIPHVVTNLGPYILALVAGTVVTALILSVVKRTIEK